MNKILKAALHFFLLVFYCTQTNAQTLVVPPSPGSLTSVEHLKQATDYTVEVKKSGDANYTACFVYRTDNYFKVNPFNIGARPQVAASFTNFSFSGTSVDVRITTSYTANSVTIRPLNYEVNFQRNGNVITFSLDSPMKLSIEVNDRNNPLFLFADEPDSPNTLATFYYGPGVHNIGKSKVIATGQSVYIAGGAVVEGSFKISAGAKNVKITGRGVLSNGEWEFPVSLDYPDMQPMSSIRNQSSQNTILEGITITNSTGWTLAMESYDGTIKNSQYRNLKIINWNISTDAIWFDGNDNIVDDCFIFNNDDILTTHSSNNCRISNMVIWGGVFGNLFMQSSYKSSNGITYENINMIGKDGGKSIIEVQKGNGTKISINNITFKNIRIEEHKKINNNSPKKFIFIEPHSQDLNNWLFENITIDDKNPDEGDIYGTANSFINGMTFRNLKMGGICIRSLAEASMDISSDYVTNLFFETSSEMSINQGSTTINNNSGTCDFGNIANGSSRIITFTIVNEGCGLLNLTATPRVSISGNGFSLVTDASTTIATSNTTTFELKFQPTVVGVITGAVSIVNSDVNANPYTFSITGTGIAINDTEAPSIPTTLTSTTQTSATVDFVWTASTDNVGVTQYEIYKDGQLVGTTTENSFSVTGLDPSTTYTFTIKAKDAESNLSEASDAIIVTTNAGEVTEIPPSNIKPRKIFSFTKDQFWQIEGIEECTVCSVIIFTRSGSKVFETSDYTNTKWDGMFNGNRLMDGGYSYVIRSNGKNLKTGTITIIK